MALHSWPKWFYTGHPCNLIFKGSSNLSSINFDVNLKFYVLVNLQKKPLFVMKISQKKKGDLYDEKLFLNSPIIIYI